MDWSLENPVVHYGMGISSALLLAIIAFVFLEGTIQWVVLGLAAVEAVFLPQILKMNTKQDSSR